ncbi:MAG: LysM peptidoglycan-binding domain-containing protein [Pseudomonadota bacterium]
MKISAIILGSVGIAAAAALAILWQQGQAPAVDPAPAASTSGVVENPSAAARETGAASELTVEMGDPSVGRADPVAEAAEDLAALSSGLSSGGEADSPTEPAASQTAPEEADATAIQLDVVRIDPKGQAVIAGQAPPGSDVELLLDGAVIATERSDPTGSFVALLRIPATGEPQRLSLRVAGSEHAEAELAARTPDLPEPAAGGSAETLAAGAAQTDAPLNPDGGSVGETIARAQPDGLSEPGTALGTASAPVRIDEDAQGTDTEDGAEDAAPSLATPAAPVDPSAPGQDVLILPAESAGEAPLLLRHGGSEDALLQPAPISGPGVRLDRISYAEGGDVDLSGRAVSGNVIRIYINAELAGTAKVVPPGVWSAELPLTRAQSARLLRFDEIAPAGDVVSRIETPFTYAAETGPKRLAEREVEIERGDYLWRIAERFYGEGIRYSVIFSANSELIRDPNLIYPGQVFTVPELVDSE